jgi:hypothetical protein
MRAGLRTIFLLWVAGLTSVATAAGSPPELVDWEDWVLYGQEFRRCPFLATRVPGESSSHRCAWPEPLTLTVTARDGVFSQRWLVYAESWVRLPGDLAHWPQDVRINGAAAPVVARDGVPAMRLAPGSHVLSGRFTWETRPESLAIAAETGIVDLTVDGRSVAQPERPDGAVWLGKRRAAEQPAALEVQVYRLVQDELPVRLVTRIRLQVAGDAREERIAVVLPPGFMPLALDSALPARIDADGRLRAQVRAGSWEVVITARGIGAADELSRPPVGDPGAGRWAREEVWSFQGNDRLRISAAEGAAAIDPIQANVPPEWQGLPAFRMAAESKLRIVERSRGLANVDDNRLSLRRELWLDFNHGGFTAVDEIAGTMRRDWRLDMADPFTLQSARIEADALLVTEGKEPGVTGVELRLPELSLQAVSRTTSTRSTLPATGWQTRFDGVHGVLHLPPGHLLLAVRGADEAPGSWLERWGLWNLFGVLIVVVFTHWLAGRKLAIVALGALLLMYQAMPEQIWLWGNLLAAIAVAAAVPEGRFRRFATGYRTLSLVVLGIVLLPFLWGQLRLALYPQLEAGDVSRPAAMQVKDSHREFEIQDTPVTAIDAAPAADEMPAQPESEDLSSVDALQARSKMYGGLNVQQVIQRYAPGTLLQTGPGIPDWRYRSYAFSWSGPVEQTQTVQFIYAGRVLFALWRVAGVALTAIFFLWLLGRTLPSGWRLPGMARNLQGTTIAAALLSLSAALMTTLVLAAIPGRALAQSTPDPTLLTELKERLLAPPKCAPSCAEIMAASVVATPDLLEVTLEASALTPVAVAVPSASDRWQLESITVDGKSAVAIARNADGSLWIPLAPGAHRLQLRGRPAAAQSLQLAFPQPPRRIRVAARGWVASGITEGRLLSGSLELTRERTASRAAGTLESAAEFPAFVRVTRSFDLDLDWSLTTTVERIAPRRAAFNIQVPLVAGESVLSEDPEIRDGKIALVGLGVGESRMSWSSGLARGETLELASPPQSDRTEVWSFVVNPQWNVGFEGFPAVLPEELSGMPWSYVFHPRPGERLMLRITRPKAVVGPTLAIDSVALDVDVGKRSANHALKFDYRSTQGGRHTLTLPADARVTRVVVDGAEVPLRPSGGELPLSLLPGAHSIGVNWITNAEVALRTRPGPVDLNSAASNVRTTIRLPQDRWPLFAFGGGVGPAFLYWAEVVVFLIVAWLLGQLRHSPLKTYEWLLLGIGLSTLSWGVLLAVGAWLFLMRWRETWDGDKLPRWRFNAIQVLLALFTVLAVSSLVFSGIRYGLLAHPDMGVAGPGSGGNTFSWFMDQTASALPRPSVISVPMWVYRTLMFAWAFWIAVALARWLRFAWRAWTARGFWRGDVVTA